MYNISRKTFLSISKIIDNEWDSMEKAEEICGMIEDEINGEPKFIQWAINKDTFTVTTPVADVAQIEKAPSKQPIRETIAEKKARIQKYVDAGMGQMDKLGNYTPLAKKMNLAKDARECNFWQL